MNDTTTRAMTQRVLINTAVAELVRRFAEAGYAFHLVGGSVRDMLAGQEAADLDFTTDALPDEFDSLLKGLGTIYRTGERFGTLAVAYGDGPDDHIEITTYRTETYDTGSRKPVVGFTKNLAADLVRRDFTVNAMALELLTGELVDLFNGQQDLRDGILCTPGDADATMREDPLRAVRAVRFAAVRDWAISEDTQAAILDNRARLAVVSQERITAELLKILRAGPQATERARIWANQVGLVQAIFGSFEGAAEPVAGNTVEAQLASMVISDPGFDAQTAGRRLVLPTSQVRQIGAIRECVQTLERPEEIHRLRRLVRGFSADVLTEAMALVRTRSLAFNDPQRIVNVDAVTDLLSTEKGLRDPLPVDGRDVMATGLQGPAVGEALRLLEAERCRSQTFTRADALGALAHIVKQMD